VNARVIFSGVATASVVLTVSRQPGNNFRVAASCDPNALGRLSVTNNVPGTIYVPGSDAAVSGFTGHITPLLTVWRRLQIELDSMAAVTGNNMTGNVTEIRGSPPAAREVSVGVALRDGSPDLDNVDVPSGLGRFENGRFLIASPFGATETLGICCNGASYIQKLSGIAIPFRITKPGLAVVTGQVWRWDANSLEFHLAVTAGNLTGSYKDGTFEVGGVAMEIRKVKTGPRIVEVKQLHPFGCSIHDDDVNTVLPKIPDTSLLAGALAEAYLVFDLVGTQDVDLPFAANVPASAPVTLPAPWQTRASNAADYWVAYVIAGFQGPTYVPVPGSARTDGDPNSELATGPVFGVTTAPAGGSIIFLETIRDLQLHINTIPSLSELYASLGIELPILEADTVVHEVGHAISQQGLHVPNTGSGVTNGSGRYLPEYLNLIRSSTRPFP